MHNCVSEKSKNAKGNLWYELKVHVLVFRLEWTLSDWCWMGKQQGMNCHEAKWSEWEGAASNSADFIIKSSWCINNVKVRCKVWLIIWMNPSLTQIAHNIQFPWLWVFALPWMKVGLENYSDLNITTFTWRHFSHLYMRCPVHWAFHYWCDSPPFSTASQLLNKP